MGVQVQHRPWLRSSVGTANDRLKHSFGALLAGSIGAAALIHFLVLVFWPAISVKHLGNSAPEVIALELPPPVEIPPPPQAIASPQVPVMSFRLDISEEVTIQEVTFVNNWVERLPPPPIRPVDLSEEPVFVPRTVEPELRRNQRNALQRYLERNYPRALLSAGVGARSVFWVFINTEGEVRETRIVESSGHPAFDRVAEEGLRTIRFSPAMNRDVRVPVWIQLPITWRVRF